MSRALRWYDKITINIYWFALNARSQTLSPLVIPVLVQALMGILSDRSTFRLGRRRPFILIGTLGEIIVFALIGFAASMEGLTGYAVLFGLYILSAIASNTAHAATQGLIPDLVPDSQRGRYSGITALLELPLPLALVSLVIGKLVSAGNLWAGLITLMVVMVICAALAMLVPAP